MKISFSVAGYFSKSIMSILVFSFHFSIAQAQQCNALVYRTTPTFSFADNADGTVTDTRTGLMWKQCVEGISSTSLACDTGTALQLNWGDALNYVQEININEPQAGYNDWRLPNIKELSSIIEYSCIEPAVNLILFPSTPNSAWSTTPSPDWPNQSLFVDFFNGLIDKHSKEVGGVELRLVRNIN